MQFRDRTRQQRDNVDSVTAGGDFAVSVRIKCLWPRPRLKWSLSLKLTCGSAAFGVVKGVDGLNVRINATTQIQDSQRGGTAQKNMHYSSVKDIICIIHSILCLRSWVSSSIVHNILCSVGSYTLHLCFHLLVFVLFLFLSFFTLLTSLLHILYISLQACSVFCGKRLIHYTKNIVRLTC